MQYLKYFFYLAYHWDIRLAYFIIRHEITGEKKYGIKTIGIDDLKKEIPAEILTHASIYQPINYYVAEKLFNCLKPEDFKNGFLDMGCGKGRTLAMAAAFGFKEIIGIDFSQKLCAEAEANISIILQKYTNKKIKIECVDAALYAVPVSVSTIFLFNPFDKLIMKEVVKQIKKSIELKPRLIKSSM